MAPLQLTNRASLALPSTPCLAIRASLLLQAEFNALSGDLARQYPDRARLWFAYDEPLRCASCFRNRCSGFE